jgi:hypothetical protein
MRVNDEPDANRAQQNARAGDVAQQHSGPGSWAGPFTVDKALDANCGDGWTIIAADGSVYALVHVEDCGKGGMTGAKARATLIAEALNARRDHVTVTVKGADLADTLRAIVRQEFAAHRRQV